jgi:catechol 2,3-dioxygenase-like lactoylglutathione lyase family enzyme
MTIQRMDHVGVVVDDLEAAIAFFVELGMELEGEAPIEGRWVDRVNGLDGVRVDIAMMRTPDGHGRLELTKFHTPTAVSAEPENAPGNTLGLRSIMFAVDDIDATVAGLRAHGAELVGEVAQYQDSYRLCYVRGPEGIIVALAEQLSQRPVAADLRPTRTIRLDGPRTTTGGITVQPNEITEVLNRPISQELLARDVTRLAYVAKDGTPRNVPIGFTWNGSEIVMCTSKNAPKLRALGENPMVALTIDTEVHPPKILLIRGRAELDFVDGIPDEYLRATSSYEMTPEQRVEWEAEVRSLYRDGMVRIVVTPTWAKLIDFETTLPSAVEELVRQREERQRG